MSTPEPVDEVMAALRARIERQEAQLAAAEATLLERRQAELERVIAATGTLAAGPERTTPTSWWRPVLPAARRACGAVRRLLSSKVLRRSED